MNLYLNLPVNKDISIITPSENMLNEYKNFHRWLLFTILNTVWTSNNDLSGVLNFLYKCSFRLFSGIVASYLHNITQDNLYIYYSLIISSCLLLLTIFFNYNKNDTYKNISIYLGCYLIIMIICILYINKSKKEDKNKNKNKNKN
jgi:hypothetical protein